MASWIEIDRIRKDPAAARALAARLLKIHRHDFTDWELDFLQSIARYHSDEELTTRQGEKLLQIRDDVELITKYHGFSIKTLIQGCYEGRMDLDEADETWIEELRGKEAIKRRFIGRLLRCARRLGNIEKYEAA
jgi:hypothetical protein